MTTKKNLEDLFNKALLNIEEDREKLIELYEKAIDGKNFDSVDEVAILGNTAVKILETLNRVNEQIVKLAQIKEREESKGKKESVDKPFSVDDIRQIMESANG